jgi:hypothetical protein
MSLQLETNQETELLSQEGIYRTLGRTVFEALATNEELEVDLDLTYLDVLKDGTVTRLPGGSTPVDD